MHRRRTHDGGTIGLSRLIVTRYDRVEADFQRYYQLDLRTQINTCSLRRLWALIHNLPPDSATHREGAAEWSNTEHMLATLLEQIDGWGRAMCQLQGVEARKLGDPLKIERPGTTNTHLPVETDRRTMATWFHAHAA